MWKIPNAAASRVSALPEKYKERKHPKRVREQNNIRLDFRQSRSAPPRVPLPVVGSLAPSPKPSVSLLLLREEKRRYRAQRRAQSGPAAPGPGFPRPPTPARSPLTVWSSAQRRRSPAAFWGETERVRQARPGPSSPPRAPGPARYPQSSRSPSMAAVPAPEAEGAGAVPAGAAHARSRRAPPTSAPEAPAPTPGRRLRALTAAARRPARRGTARAESAAPRGAAARSPGPPVSSEAAPRDSPRGGAAARRRGARSGERGQRRGAFPRHHGAARGPAAGRAGGRLRLRARLPALRRGLLHRVRPLPQVRARSVRGGALPRAGAGARGDPSEPTQPRLPPRVGFWPPCAALPPLLLCPRSAFRLSPVVACSISVAALSYLYTERPQLNPPRVFPVRPRWDPRCHRSQPPGTACRGLSVPVWRGRMQRVPAAARSAAWMCRRPRRTPPSPPHLHGVCSVHALCRSVSVSLKTTRFATFWSPPVVRFLCCMISSILFYFSSL